MKSNIFSNVRSFVCGLTNLTAGGTGDNTAVTGATINRSHTIALGNGDNGVTFLSNGKLIVTYKATLTASQTLSLAIAYQTSADGSSWNTAVTLLASTAVLDATGSGVKEYDLALVDKPQYIRFNFTPDLSHSGTDTAVVSATFVAEAEANGITRSA
jgi:hypothetical protein